MCGETDCGDEIKPLETTQVVVSVIWETMKHALGKEKRLVDFVVHSERVIDRKYMNDE